MKTELKSEKQPCNSSAILLDKLLLASVIVVQLFIFICYEENPYLNGFSILSTFLIALVLIGLILINWGNKIPLLTIFLIVFIGYWHLRFLTLLLFPQSSIVLERTVLVDQNIFYNYTMIVLAGLIAASLGILTGEWISRSTKVSNLSLTGVSIAKLAKQVTSSYNGFVVYSYFCLLYQIAATVMGPEAIASTLPYIGMLVNNFVVFAVIFLQLVNKRDKKLLYIFLLLNIILVSVSGNRSIILITGFSILVSYIVVNRTVMIPKKMVLFSTAIIPVIIVVFIFGTFNRYVRTNDDYRTVFDKTRYVVESIQKLDEFELVTPLLEKALGRAGYLDYGAEIFANKKYNSVINLEGIVKSIIDNHIPSDVFDDGRRVSYKIRDIYAPNATGYQSDCLTAVGETFRVFGFGFVIVIAFIGFSFTVAYNLAHVSIYGFFLKILLCLHFVGWWNSFGFDWMVIEFGRDLVFGMFCCFFILRYERIKFIFLKN